MYYSLVQSRKSRRLQHFDYSKEGLYFITLNTEARMRLFGEIVDEEIRLSEEGKIAESCWIEIPDHFPEVELHDFVIMPDHIHGVLEITVGANHHSPEKSNDSNKQKFRSPSKTIGSIIRGYKIGVTKLIRRNNPELKVWQRDYYEHIIRNTESFERICQYIRNNPKNWNKHNKKGE